MNEWFKTSVMRNLVDMHIPNGEGLLDKFDPKVYAENIKKSGADVAYVYGSNCLGLCFFPTKIGNKHKAADRDIFGQTVAECKKLGLRVVGYLNSWGTTVSDMHPDWDIVGVDGKSMRSWRRFGNPCPNSDYGKYFTDLVYEFCSMYEFDGLWVDMVGMWMPACFCDACKKKYFEETGREIPTIIDWNNPEFVDYINFKGRSIADYGEKIREAALRANPSLSISLQAASIEVSVNNGLNDIKYYKQSDYVAGDFYTDRHGVNVISRMMYNLTENLPFEFMTTRCSRLRYHTMNKPFEDLELEAYSALMYNGAFLFIDAIDPSGEMNPLVYERMSRVGRNIRRYEKFVNYDERPMRDVAVYYNFNSAMTTEENGKSIKELTSKRMTERIKKIDKALTPTHTDYDVLTRNKLSKLPEYKVVIFSDLSLMSDEEIEAVREYVKGGGHAYISGETSLRSDKGELYSNFKLSDVLGLDYEGVYEIAPNYLAPTSESPEIFGDYTRKYPNMLWKALNKVTPNDEGEILATATLPISDVTDRFLYTSAISNPPITYLENPAIFKHKYGCGEVIYSAGVIEEDEMLDNSKLFANLVLSLLPEKKVTINAPDCVDATAYRLPNRIKINLLNHQSIRPIIKIDNVRIEIKLDGVKKINKVYDSDENEVAYTVENGKLVINTPLEVFKMILVDFE